MSDIITARDSDIVAAEINTIKEDTRRIMIANAIRIGGKLMEAKSMVPFGEWGKWLKEKVDYSQSTAEDLMKLHREYGENQESLFDTWTKSETFGNLSYSKHLALLALPFADRQEFAEQNDVESLSTRELEKLLKQAQAQLGEAQSRADTAEENAEKAADAALQAEQRFKAREEDLQRQANEAREARDKEAACVDELKAQLKKAKAAEKTAKEQLKQAQENPQVPEAVMEQMRKEVEADAAKQATEEIQKKLDEALAKADAATKAAQVAEEKLATAQKAAKLSNPLVVAFRVKFEKVQQEYTAMIDDLKEMRKEDPKLAEGMTNGIRALLELWQQNLEG